jgi:hypothetical protein
LVKHIGPAVVHRTLAVVLGHLHEEALVEQEGCLLVDVDLWPYDVDTNLDKEHT